MDTIETWRIRALINTFEDLARNSREQQLRLAATTLHNLSGYYEGRASTQEQAAKWLSEALATAATAKPRAA